ncbi:pilus assembly protein CpaD [Hyphomonas neptunium ATCC 15444]|uniref:Pilus assembly protein CpaD n=2 Tax=Hyphomonas TaxID=85 RepID=Q0BXV3_HYPNA|nr:MULTISPECIES: CpaD family pilus assembly lipoprotein [Hyphomonas]ABI76447.1 pilus assembly protein CpaD [Hyphomonas neptunium ATCC 15444]KCZ93619.1 pilus assembly protein CpaD [Hyphomonas hirschiana VP5]
MTRHIRSLKTLIALGAGAAAITACASVAPTAVPAAYLETSPLDLNPIKVEKRTEFLEVSIDAYAGELSSSDRARIQDFMRGYVRRGHGPLVLSMPQVSSNPQLAVAAVAEARAIAWDMGVEYQEISGTAHGSGSSVSEPMILAYQSYEAIAPNCPPKSTVDFSNIDSNNQMETLGCSVRTNLAAMIIDPADLLGNRPLDRSDLARREVILEKFRAGESTASERSSQESGAVSSAVQ